MTSEPEPQSALAAMQRINQVWLNGNVEDLAPMVHPDIMMAPPGFAGRIRGRDQFLAGFSDFCTNARVHSFRAYEYETDTVGSVAVITYRYEMLYERAGERYQAAGRDLWVFQQHHDEWLAVWRTMLDMDEKPG